MYIWHFTYFRIFDFNNSSEYALKESHSLSFLFFLGFCVVVYESVALTVSSDFIWAAYSSWKLFYFYVYGCFACAPHSSWCLRRPEETSDPWDCRYRGCEPSCEFWELNSAPLEEQRALGAPGPSLHLWRSLFLRTWFPVPLSKGNGNCFGAPPELA